MIFLKILSVISFLIGVYLAFYNRLVQGFVAMAVLPAILLVIPIDIYKLIGELLLIVFVMIVVILVVINSKIQPLLNKTLVENLNTIVKEQSSKILIIDNNMEDLFALKQ
ncbi:hypothetical protein O8I42_01745 [Campylobacter lari]|uniref:hypothetical protein n=1 Tax=Campylobacter lari TaxID=201 RepID=UPI00126BAEC5|nr:hypothetical protein [Campylobacter lari]EAK0794600.1 hypothetical protein [Campylobacter lari]EAK9875806.1 hypothetical protein [Campylobacter lari]MCV3394807.1 hypothetical protein [Campylobacter lari]MCV3461113.1 hypothetical protein [Campylobacter lari]